MGGPRGRRTSRPGARADVPPSVLSGPAGSSVAFSPGNLSTSSSASSTLGSPENEEYILSFETIDKMRRVSSYSALNSLIGECRARFPPAHGTQGSPTVRARSWDAGTVLVGHQALTGVWRCEQCVLQATASSSPFNFALMRCTGRSGCVREGCQKLPSAVARWLSLQSSAPGEPSSDPARRASPARPPSVASQASAGVLVNVEKRSTCKNIGTLT